MKPSSSGISRARPLLGTFVQIRAPDFPGIHKAFEAIERVQRLMSAHAADSDVSRISRAAAGSCIRVDPWTHEVLRRALEIHRATDGLFDCTVAPALMRLGHLPCHAPVIPEGSLCDLELLADCMVRVHRAVAVTLDGIAKGYAVDRAVDVLVQAGAETGSVNAGGDLRVWGGKAEPVHVRDPRSPGRFIRIGEIRDAAVASSAGPVVDPRTMTLQDLAGGVTVIAEDCTTADTLTKPCRLDPARAGKLAAQFDAKALIH
jgi:thiamine biosynthesis lipoprotein